MPRQLDKLNPHMHKEARIGIQNYDNGYTQEELDENIEWSKNHKK